MTIVSITKSKFSTKVSYVTFRQKTDNILFSFQYVLIFFYLFSLHLFLFTWLNFIFLFTSDLDCFSSLQKKRKNLFLGFEAKQFSHPFRPFESEQSGAPYCSWQIQFYFEFTTMFYRLRGSAARGSYILKIESDLANGHKHFS